MVQKKKKKKGTSVSELCFDIFEMGIVDSPGDDCCSMIYDPPYRRWTCGFVSLSSKTKHERLSLPSWDDLDSYLDYAIDKDAIGECPRTSMQSFSTMKNIKKE